MCKVGRRAYKKIVKKKKGVLCLVSQPSAITFLDITALCDFNDVNVLADHL